MRGKYTWKASVGSWLSGIARYVYYEWLRARPSAVSSVEELDSDQQLSGDEDDIFDGFWQRESGASPIEGRGQRR